MLLLTEITKELKQLSINLNQIMSFLDKIIRQQKNNEAVGITSICSANPQVLETSLRHAQKVGNVVLIESTCNQVNQFGGYTGMTPIMFATYLRNLAEQIGFPVERLYIGGDHLGPNVWKKEPAASAMKKARAMVNDYVNAGYQKIHIDTSMSCCDDPQDRPLAPQIIAERTADLMAISESTFSQLGHQTNYIRYIIGTEVPPPGGMQGHEGTVMPTKPEMVQETFELTRHALEQRGLASVWERVIAIVVQPGVEYGDQIIIDYVPEAAAGLKSYIERINGMVYEAHSTDYQTCLALKHLVEDHFAILKVGPALTFAYREAIYALALIEEELFATNRDWQPSNIIDTLEAEMLDNPEYWQDYYRGTEQMKNFSRHYSFSDRIRYYWLEKRVQLSLNHLLKNLQSIEIPLSLLSQYLPDQFHDIRLGVLDNKPKSIILDSISRVLLDYNYACGQ